MSKQLTIYDGLNEPSPFTERHEDDFYETPARLTKELLDRVPISGSVLEPCCGKNAIADVLDNQPNIKAVGTDINLDGLGKPTDATTKKYWEAWRSHFKEHYGGLNWVVTNPPFNQAHLILPLALEYSSVGVAFLLRNTYTEPCQNRDKWLIANSDRHRYRIEINPRPQFREEKGSDSASVSWLVWQKDWSWQNLGMKSPFGYITGWK